MLTKALTALGRLTVGRTRSRRSNDRKKIGTRLLRCEPLENRQLLSITPYAIVDTGQTDCYDNLNEIIAPIEGSAFYGQDAQHDGNQADYTTSADGLTVLDNITGLTWTQGADWTGDGVVDADDKFTYDEAQAFVDTLNAQNYGGYDDWSVPTTKELYSLIDFRGTDPNVEATNPSGLTPFIDDDVFEFAYGDTSAGERIIDSQWVTSTLYTGTVMDNATAMFGVNFADGRIKGYPVDAMGPGGVEKTFYARFVRGNEDYGVNDFVDNGDGTITDEATDLMWTKADSGQGMDWESALAWVQQMNDQNYLGYNDWRLPNAKELQSIVDYSRSPDATNSAAIDPVFEATQITNEAGEADYPFYWSSTTFLRSDGTAGAAVYVAFGEGLGSMDGVTVIDVHGAGCQRSDPKTGDPADYPSWGNGPQGDVQRVFNYIRLVRDVEASENLIPGDTNKDDKVDSSDLAILANHWQIGVNGGPAATWEQGDFNEDGKVDSSDMGLLANRWQEGVRVYPNTTREVFAASTTLNRQEVFERVQNVSALPALTSQTSTDQLLPPPPNGRHHVATVPQREALPPRRLIVPVGLGRPTDGPGVQQQGPGEGCPTDGPGVPTTNPSGPRSQRSGPSGSRLAPEFVDTVFGQI